MRRSYRKKKEKENELSKSLKGINTLLVSISDDYKIFLKQTITGFEYNVLIHQEINDNLSFFTSKD